MSTKWVAGLSAIVLFAVCSGARAEEQAVGFADESGWKSLFNGKDLSGWIAEGHATWKVEDACLVGVQGPGNKPGDLLTEAEYADFELVVTYQIQWPANSGVWFRYQSPQKAYQADILEYKDPECYSGTLYCPGKMFLFMNEDPDLVKRDGWNTLTIRAEGDLLKVGLNGVDIGEVRDDLTSHGRIGFQIHAGDQFKDMKITVREIKIRPLG